jgi:hypothetical protein
MMMRSPKLNSALFYRLAVGESPRGAMPCAYCDPASHLPVCVEGSGSQGTRSLVATVTFRFDPAIKIEMPKAE